MVCLFTSFLPYFLLTLTIENDCGYSIVESYKGTILTVGNDDSVENSSRKLKIWSGNELKYEMMFITPIMGVRLNASYIVVCLENEIFVYDMNLKQCRNYKTKLNGRGVVALSNNDYLAYPYENDFIVTNLNDDHKKKFSANINISSIQFSNNSEKVAIVDESVSIYSFLLSKISNMIKGKNNIYILYKR